MGLNYYLKTSSSIACCMRVLEASAEAYVCVADCIGSIAHTAACVRNQCCAAHFPLYLLSTYPLMCPPMLSRLSTAASSLASSSMYC